MAGICTTKTDVVSGTVTDAGDGQVVARRRRHRHQGRRCRGLAGRAGRIADAWPDRADVHAYFNDDDSVGPAVRDADAFTRAVAAKRRTVASARGVES